MLTLVSLILRVFFLLSFKDEPSRAVFFFDQGWVVYLGPEESPWMS